MAHAGLAGPFFPFLEATEGALPLLTDLAWASKFAAVKAVGAAWGTGSGIATSS